MKSVNSVIIPRNHQIEAAIHAALGGDFQPFHKLTEALENPFDESHADSDLAEPPSPDEVVERKFCRA